MSTQQNNPCKITRALISVTDKTGVIDFAKKLEQLGVELVSTGGTAKLLRESGIAVRDISELTGFPEMLDGRVKTLHPKVHGGILHIRGNKAHRSSVEEHGILPIDMVVVNLYAFEKTAKKPGVEFQEIVENIDIGGPSMIRSAAKNFGDVAVITSPEDYPGIAAELDSNGSLSLETRWRLAKKAFANTAAYDTAIAATLEKIADPGLMYNSHPSLAPIPEAGGLAQSGAPLIGGAAGEMEQSDFPTNIRLSYIKKTDLRYGENPHQRAALYADSGNLLSGIANCKQLQGKDLSYNNLVDLQAAWDLAQEFDEIACVIVKHTNPCGTATGESILQAYQKALEADPVSAFGGVIGLNRPLNGVAAQEIAKLFVEAVAAPSFDQEARAIFSSKKNLRLVEITPAAPGKVFKQVSGGMLMQDADLRPLTAYDLKVVTHRQPTGEQLRAMLFAWKVCKHVKSNAIVYARDGQSVGIGAGQMSRVDSCKLGALKATLPLAGTVVASDAFFPFPDGLEEAAKAGAVAIIQPGGSVRDPEVIAAADRLGLAMIFTGVRHFRH